MNTPKDWLEAAKRITYSESMPIVECPHCHKVFQWDDYYDMQEGDSRECPQCEKEIFVIGVSQVTTGMFSTHPPPKP